MKGFFTIIIISLLFITCSRDVEPISISDVEEDITLELIQNLEKENSYYWLITTNKANQCEDAQLVCTTEYSEGTHLINILGITEVEDCVDSTYILKTTKKIDLIDSVSPIEINLRNIINYDGLIIDHGSYITFDVENTNGIQVKTSTLNKIEPTFLWIGVSGDNPFLNASLQELEQWISAESHPDYLFKQGNYGYFFYGSSINIQEGTENVNYKYRFLFNLKDEMSADHPLYHVIIEFLQAYPDINYEIKAGNNFEGF